MPGKGNTLEVPQTGCLRGCVTTQTTPLAPEPIRKGFIALGKTPWQGRWCALRFRGMEGLLLQQCGEDRASPKNDCLGVVLPLLGKNTCRQIGEDLIPTDQWCGLYT